jgi:cobalt-zinc-cadmium efflux system protein
MAPLRDSIDMSMVAARRGTNVNAVRSYLLQRPGVVDLHDLRVRPISTAEPAMTWHLVMPGGHPDDDFLMDVARTLKATAASLARDRVV